MFYKKTNVILAGMALAACLFAPQRAQAQTVTQMDGVMGQSMTDETVYEDPGLDARILKNSGLAQQPNLLGATTYSSAFLNASFTTEGDYTSATYYHKNDYAQTQLINGIDVSYWQADATIRKTYASDRTKWNKTGLDWARIHDAGVDFAFVRVASRDTKDGSIYEDNCADSHIQGALANNINVGLYFFSQALNETEAQEEAQYVLDMIEDHGWDVTMPIVMDREAGANKRLTAGKLSKAKETAVCQAFADTLVDAGYRATVYASYAWIKNYIDTDSLSDCSLWIARYNNTTTNNTKSGTPYADTPYDYEFWQYSSKAAVDGYTGSLDANFWYKDTSAQTTGLKLTDDEAGTVTLNWDAAASDVSGYRVYRYDDAQGKYVCLKATAACSYTDTTVESGTAYKYKVRCYWKIGGNTYYGSYSSAVSAVTPPNQVSGLTTQTRKAESLTLKWNAAEGAAGYEIALWDAEEDNYETVADVESDATSYTVSDLEAATEYKFKIRAYEKNNGTVVPGTWSDEYADTTLPTRAEVTAVSAVGTTGAKLTWSAMTGVTGYVVYRTDSTDGELQQVATVKGEKTTSYTDQGLTAGKTYTYQVCAYKTYQGEDYYGELSEGQKLSLTNTAKPAKVKNVKATTKASSVTLKWSKVSGVTGYQVYRYNTTLGKYVKLGTVKGAATVSFQNTKLKKGTTYRYKVRAYKTENGKNVYGTFSTAVSIKVK